MKQHYPILLLVCTLLFAGCSPFYVVRLEPGTEEVSDRMLYGNALLQKSVRDIDVSISYYDASPDYIVFNLEVFNGSDRAFDFNPADVGILSNNGQQHRAIDPEFQLLSMDLNEARRRTNNRTMAWVGGALLIAGTVASVASDLSSSSGESFTNTQVAANLSIDVGDIILTTVADANLRSIQHYSIPRENIPLPNSRYFWLDHSLRITTIGPGERVVGKVVFPRMDEAQHFNVFVPTPSGEVSFSFDQRVFRP